MIEIIQESEDSYAKGVMFRWRGMTIYLGLTQWPDGEKCLTFATGDVKHAELIYPGNSASWTISKEASGRKDAGASITSSGSALNVTGKNMED